MTRDQAVEYADSVAALKPFSVTELGGVILDFQVKGATYRLNVIMPPGELLAEALGTIADTSQMIRRQQKRRSW